MQEQICSLHSKFNLSNWIFPFHSMASSVIIRPPHVLLIPLPAQGHAPPMLRLAELLCRNAGFYITFVNTEDTHCKFITNSSSSFSSSYYVEESRFRFRTIPDGIPKDTSSPLFQQFFQILDSMRIRSAAAPKDLLILPTTSNSTGTSMDGWPPVTCVVADGAFTLALDIVEEVGIPLIVLRTSGACSIWAYYCLPALIKGGEIPFPEEAELDLDEEIRSVPGMTEGILRRRDLPSLLRHAKSSTDSVVQYLISISNNLSRGSALILNTFEALEGTAISHLRSVCPITYPIGPFHLLLQRSRSSSSSKAKARASLWPEDWTCMAWLDSQPDKSVVYVSFGSITKLSREEVVEFRHGLINSGHRFLWVVRPDIMVDEENCNMIMSLLERERERERCMVVEWAPQEEVLAHPAVGCFLTHSGWNSTIESLVAGVPMVCWPFIADQHINSRFVSKVWKAGLDMKDTCDRNTVERMVKEVMDIIGDGSSTSTSTSTSGAAAGQLRRSAINIAKEAYKSAAQGGTSTTELHKLIQHIRSLS